MRPRPSLSSLPSLSRTIARALHIARVAASSSALLATLVCAFALVACRHGEEKVASPELYRQVYERKETRDLVALVNDAASMIDKRGRRAFDELRVPGSRWRQGEAYVFVLDLRGTMLVHPDPALEGKSEIDLKDVDGKPIIRGLLGAATAAPSKPEGWYHYQWPVPGGLLPRWKSSYVRLATTPSGERLVVGAGVYDDRMERVFVVDAVKDAVARIEQTGEAAFPLLRDKTGPFLAKDSYVFVLDAGGVDLVNPAFPNLEGQNLLGMKDTQGKTPIREMIDVVSSRGSGWVDYMWPKPGESVSTQKSTYVERARLGDRWLVVGSGVYLADAPKAPPPPGKMTAPELVKLVREAAAMLEKNGERGLPMLREQGSKWLHDETYFFVWTLDGRRVLHAADPSIEGQNVAGMTDIVGRPIGKWFLDVGASRQGEGWVHYMYPEPGNVFPVWKSTFAKRVRFPSGTSYLVGSGLYNMQMDRTLIEDVVHRASALIVARGEDAFATLRDKKGPFVFMDTYVFVDTPDGVEVVNAAQPSLEGRNLASLTDAKGKLAARDYIDAAMKRGAAWVEYDWFKPGHNTPAHKRTYVQKVQHGATTYVVGSGYYTEE